jgi:DMSO/TMAO reductase YedYZ molybdopterin-dependent catalytic subunit
VTDWARSVDDRLLRLAPPRVGPFREGAFGSRLHSERNAAWLGLSLGVTFTVCFVTGLLSHGIQHPPSWFLWPSRPAGLYRVTQGIHVATGIASIPLLLAKLWTVYPLFWTWPPFRSVAHLFERLSLFPLVGGSLFLLFSGLASIARWSPWPFSFPAAHYAAAWITIGALVVHVGAKLGLTARALSWKSTELAAERSRDVARAGLTRRGFLGTVAAATGAVTLTTVGQTVRPLAFLGLLAPRDPRVGPQGFPVNHAADKAGVIEAAISPSYRLTVEGNVATPLSFTLRELRAFPQHQATLPIPCVDGWSASATWRGVRVRDLLAMAGAPDGAEAEVVSLQAPGSAFASSVLNRWHASDPDTLLALEINGEPLHIDHGSPVRLIGPNRPGVMQTKWVTRVAVQ